ncbi:PIG-L family deacetylase [Verrucosispora sp. ts21]|uniref:PIG-L deacetylase family protein n=1 Tax=Verrucosispora sp. ts21 TaxID=2069341 RepID=UPI000C87E278|nr:PIG-L family deacetylase [Verrucosispora sp. ts21]PMR61542.1 PIG-L family deacetylase [Verrucosispora sp. ts21]
MNVDELGSILGIWAHPDDEAYLSAGLMAMARDAGSEVVCVTATRGERGTPDPLTWPPDRLAEIRQDELTRSLRVLGVTKHHWLGYSDGECANVAPAEPVARLSELIDEIRPDTIVTFGPDGHTGHPDHQAVSAWVESAFRRTAPAGTRLLHAAVSHDWAHRWSDVHRDFSIFQDGYPLAVDHDQLAVELLLDDRTLARKLRALTEQASQTSGLITLMGLSRYTRWVSQESFVEATLVPDSPAAR